MPLIATPMEVLSAMARRQLGELLDLYVTPDPIPWGSTSPWGTIHSATKRLIDAGLFEKRPRGGYGLTRSWLIALRSSP